jgi:hypothetical protein
MRTYCTTEHTDALNNYNIVQTTMIMHVAQDAARSALKQRRGSGEGVVVLGI